MDTARTVYTVSTEKPGSEVAGEMAAALAASSIVFRSIEPAYSDRLMENALRAFEFADNYRGAYSDDPGLKAGVCPFYCDFDGYQVNITTILFSSLRSLYVFYHYGYVLPLCDDFEWAKTCNLKAKIMGLNWMGSYECLTSVIQAKLSLLVLPIWNLQELSVLGVFGRQPLLHLK